MKYPHHYDQMMMTNSIEKHYDKDNLDKVYEELYEAQVMLEHAYQKVTPRECASKQGYMTQAERSKFEAILDKYKVLFNGKLGLYPHKKFHLQLKEGAAPIHKKPYAVP